jgi:ATP-binding protein involved in chromosome partitioning
VPTLTDDAVRSVLAKVVDPEIRRPITELNMVDSVAVGDDGACCSQWPRAR